MRRFVTDIGRVCLKNLTSGSGTNPHVDLHGLCENIFLMFNIRVSPEVMARLFRHTAGMISSVVDGFESFTDGQSEGTSSLVHFCINNCERLKSFPATLITWDSEHHVYSTSEVLDFWVRGGHGYSVRHTTSALLEIQ